ncbi:adenosylcobinamide-GDP ribazoletransferase [Arenibaculum pallidiluteum]|uniref:adenosylcobinamide-GDP ribazoletransferase n=1 Tax=Arenibaculum pallidiluteum TaxID=2812559 RepID=UPI001A96FCB6|nr:adenosylcobinamide-GDP ribazoletransferase [Arenibaculum pallidiluteum]
MVETQPDSRPAADGAPERGRPLDELAAAAAFLTRLPVPWPVHGGPDLPGRAMAWYPLVGAALGLLGGLVHALAMGLGATPLLAALLALLALVLVTGALHEDGLADSVDGFGGGRDREAKLRIMRDSRLGTFGALALIFTLSIRAAAIMALDHPGQVAVGLVASETLSRAVLPVLGAYLPPARPGGLGESHGRTAGLRAVAALVLGACLAGLAVGPAMLPCAAAAMLAALLWARLAERQVGGQTGDVLGGAQQVTAAAVLLVLALLAPAVTR